MMVGPHDAAIRPVRPEAVLLVDDEPDWLELCRDELAAGGYDVRTAVGGIEGLHALESWDCSVVVTDFRMPGMSGLELLQGVKDASPSTEVVIVTAYADLDVALECVRRGAFDLLRKPLDTALVHGVVARACERRSLRTAAELHHASQTVFASQSPDRLVERIVRATLEVMGADSVSLMLPDLNGTLYVAHAHGLAVDPEGVSLGPGERVAGRIATMPVPEPALINGPLESDPRFADLTSFGRVGSSIVHPLIWCGQLVGVLNMNRASTHRPFAKPDMERASVLASQVLLALENDRLLRKVIASERLATLGQLASGVAHEINNPAAYVLSSLEYVSELVREPTSRGPGCRMCGGDDEPQRALADALEGARRIRDIVVDMSALGRSQDDTAVFDLNQAVRSALRITSAQTMGRARVSVRLGADVMVRGSVSRVSQVFVNLLLNALQSFQRADPAANEIVIATWREGDSVHAEVSDCGAGIQADHVGRIFEPWFTTKPAGVGTGLGLAIVRDTMRALEGDIRVKSELGRGTTFSLSLPWASGQAARTRRSSPPPPPPLSASLPTKPRLAPVLFVDDEPGICRSYQRYFRARYEVVVASGGLAAMRIMSERQDFRAIVCDMKMPDLSGRALLAQVREKFPALAARLLFVTGSTGDADGESDAESVGVPILRKPMALADLHQAIEARAAAASIQV